MRQVLLDINQVILFPPIDNVVLKSDDGTTNTQIYCEVNEQQFYIGSGIYTSASNPNSEFYHNIFLPFYGRMGDRFIKHPSEDGSGDAETIISYILRIMEFDFRKNKVGCQ